MSKFLRMTRELSWRPEKRSTDAPRPLKKPPTFAELFTPPDAASPPDVGSAPDAASPPDIASGGRLKQKPRIHHCSLVQHGHSHTEQAVYEVLWDSGKAGEGDRIVEIGVSKIAQRSFISERNVPAILQRLILKRAIAIEAEEQSHQCKARKYRVFHFRKVLDLRCKHGLEWVTRGRGVDFVDQYSGQAIKLQPPDAISPPDAVSAPDPRSSPPPDAASGQPPDAVSPPSLDKNLQGITTSSSFLQEAFDSLDDPQILVPDSVAVRPIEQRRGQIAAEVGEVVALYVAKHREFHSTGAKYPRGVLLKDLDVWLTPRDLKRLRVSEQAKQSQRALQAESERHSSEELESRFREEFGFDLNRR